MKEGERVSEIRGRMKNEEEGEGDGERGPLIYLFFCAHSAR